MGYKLRGFQKKVFYAGWGLRLDRPPNCGKIPKIAEKLRFWVKEIAVRTKNFGFHDSGQGKGRQNSRFKKKPKLSRKFDLAYLGSIFINFDF